MAASLILFLESSTYKYSCWLVKEENSISTLTDMLWPWHGLLPSADPWTPDDGLVLF